MVGWLDEWMVSWLVCRSISWLVGWLACLDYTGAVHVGSGLEALASIAPRKSCAGFTVKVDRDCFHRACHPPTSVSLGGGSGGFGGGWGRCAVDVVLSGRR